MNRKSVFLFLLSSVVAISALADNSVLTSVSAAQRWPWNGKIDIDYTLASVESFPVFRVAFFGQIGGGEVFSLGNLEGDGACGVTFGSGAKRVTWDASVDYPSIDTSQAKFGVVALDVTSQSEYLVLDLADYTMSNSASGPDVAQDSCKTTKIWFRRINPGTFMMGSAADEPGRSPTGNGEDQHQVTITKPYYIGVLECTASQYAKIDSESVVSQKTPKVQVNIQILRGSSYGTTWPKKTDFRVDDDSFFGRMRQKTGWGIKFDLPTEAQWEMAARDKGDGTYHGDYVWNDGSTFLKGGEADYSDLDNLAWYQDPDSAVHEVGLKNPGMNGLYDIHGNAWELCLDRYISRLGYNPVTDPVGSLNGTSIVVKGGCVWATDPPEHCRLAMRMGKSVPKDDWNGFRIAIQY